VAASWWGLRRSRATSAVLADVIVACQLIAGLLLIGLAFIGAAGVMKSRAPQHETTRAVLEYAAVFFLHFAVVIFKNAVVGRRQGNGRVLPVPDWMQRSWVEAGSAFSVVLCLRSLPCSLRWSSTRWLWLPLRYTSGPGCEVDTVRRIVNGQVEVPAGGHEKSPPWGLDQWAAG
jgi:hypothetical protein